MDNGILRFIAGGLAVGLTLCGPGTPAVFAQVEITPEIREACQQFEPELREIALTEVVPKLEESARPDASPEAKAEAEVVETTATAIHEATETTKQTLSDPEAVARQAVETLAKSGVPPEVASKVEAQMREALARVSETLRGGGTLDDAAKYFESCQRAIGECSPYLGGRDIKEVLTAGSVGGPDRSEIRSLEFLGSVADPTQRDLVGGCLEAHYREVMLGGGMETLGAPPVEMFREMQLCGVNPVEVFRGGHELPAIDPRAIEHMSPEEKAMFDAWQKGDLATIETHMRDMAVKAGLEHGMSPETIAHEIATMEAFYREGTTTPTSDAPRTETSGTSVTTFENHYADGHPVCPAGRTHAAGVPGDNPGHCT